MPHLKTLPAAGSSGLAGLPKGLAQEEVRRRSCAIDKSPRPMRRSVVSRDVDGRRALADTKRFAWHTLLGYSHRCHYPAAFSNILN